jgi:hypothetical protein
MQTTNDQRTQELEETINDLELRYLRLKDQNNLLRPLTGYEHIIGWTILLIITSAIFTIGYYVGRGS